VTKERGEEQPVFDTYAAFEIITSTDSHTRQIKLPEHNKVLMIHVSANKKYGSCLRYLIYGAFTLIPNTSCVKYA
jgi:hypothetical protein